MAITSLAERQDLASQMKDKHGGDVVSYVGCSSWGIAGQSCAPFATSAVRMQSGASSQWNMTPPPGAYDPQLPSGKKPIIVLAQVERQCTHWRQYHPVRRSAGGGGKRSSRCIVRMSMTHTPSSWIQPNWTFSSLSGLPTSLRLH